MSNGSDRSIKPGDLFEDGDLHPVVCLDSSGKGLFSVSLVDGSCREYKSKKAAQLRRLSVADAIAWKFSGPGSKKDLIPKPWWRSNKGIDPVAPYHPTFPESVAVGSGHTFKPGDFYEGSFFHPCICLWVINDDRIKIGGVSLVNGIYPQEEDLMHSGTGRLTPQEAWIWRTKGPQYIGWAEIEGLSLEEAIAKSFVDTDDEADPRRRWWK